MTAGGGGGVNLGTEFVAVIAENSTSMQMFWVSIALVPGTCGHTLHPERRLLAIPSPSVWRTFGRTASVPTSGSLASRLKP